MFCNLPTNKYPAHVFVLFTTRWSHFPAFHPEAPTVGEFLTDSAAPWSDWTWQLKLWEQSSRTCQSPHSWVLRDWSPGLWVGLRPSLMRLFPFWHPQASWLEPFWVAPLPSSTQRTRKQRLAAAVMKITATVHAASESLLLMRRKMTGIGTSGEKTTRQPSGPGRSAEPMTWCWRDESWACWRRMPVLGLSC